MFPVCFSFGLFRVRKPLLSYFGEVYRSDSCEACDYCAHSKSHDSRKIKIAGDSAQEVEGGLEQVDLTAPAQKFLTCVLESGQIFGMVHIVDILRGSRAKKLLRMKHDQLPSFSTGGEYTKEQWRHFAGQFIRKGLVKRTQPHGSLVVTDEGRAVLKGKTISGLMSGALFQTEIPISEQEYDSELYEQMRALRASLATERNVPPYVIFHDRSMIEMAQYFPLTPEALGQIYGVGRRKLEEYAPYFLPVIQAYCREKDIQPVPKPATHRGSRVSVTGKNRMDVVWEQFQAGKSLDLIAGELGIKPNTALKHLQRAFEAGRSLNLDELKKISELSEEVEHRVVRAFDEFGTFRLRPIFDALDGTVSYDQLHLWRLIYEVKNR